MSCRKLGALTLAPRRDFILLCAGSWGTADASFRMCRVFQVSLMSSCPHCGLQYSLTAASTTVAQNMATHPRQTNRTGGQSWHAMPDAIRPTVENCGRWAIGCGDSGNTA